MRWRSSWAKSDSSRVINDSSSESDGGIVEMDEAPAAKPKGGKAKAGKPCYSKEAKDEWARREKEFANTSYNAIKEWLTPDTRLAQGHRGRPAIR